MIPKKPTKPVEPKPPAQGSTWSIRKFFSGKQDREYLSQNLSVLIASGMPIIEALTALKEDARSKWLIEKIEGMIESIKSGLSLSATFKNSELFSDSAITLVRIGEESGKLPENLKLLALQEKKDRAFKSKIVTAMTYPVLVLGVTAAVGIGIAWFILPKLALVFGQLKIQLPFLTKALIAIGGFLGEYGIYAVPGAILLVVIIVVLFLKLKKMRPILEFAVFVLPGVRQLLKETEIARFGYLAGTLLKAGLPVVDSLDSIENSTTFSRYRRLYGALKSSIEDGNTFEASFSKINYARKLLSAPVRGMIISAEKSGDLPEALLKIGEDYELRTELTTKNLAVVIEPILLVLVWLGVLAVALAVILPIYSLVGQLNY